MNIKDHNAWTSLVRFAHSLVLSRTPYYATKIVGAVGAAGAWAYVGSVPLWWQGLVLLGAC